MLKKFELCSVKKGAYLCYISNLLIIRYVPTKGLWTIFNKGNKFCEMSTS